jgi:hypothetical protein
MRSNKPSNVLRNVLLVAALPPTLFLTGCASSKAPAGFPEGVNWVADRHQVRDAKAQRVKGMPTLRMDVALEDRLNAVLNDDDLSRAKKSALSVLDDAHALALKSTENELARLDDAGWTQLAQVYYQCDVTPDDQTRRLLAGEFQRQSELQLWFLKQRVDHAADVQTLRAVLEPVRKNTERSPKTGGRLARSAPGAIFALPALLARGAIHANEAVCQIDGPFKHSVHYAPAESTGSGALPHWDLLERYAPVLVQEINPESKYAPTADQIGRVFAQDDGTIDLDLSQPAVYAYTRTIVLNDRPHLQLSYAYWYPERPKLKDGVDAEAGKYDGGTIRITLDAQNRPAMLETLNNCGCHHRIYPTSTLEAAAKDAFGGPAKGKRLSVERDVSGKYDLIIPKVIDASENPHVLARCRAGTHALVDLDYSDARHGQDPVAGRRSYVLLPYDELEQLKTPGGKTVSMFLPNGLVRGAERLEGTLFKPLGMLNAGQPRQRGTQLIQWDQYDFDDPRLFEKALRLPGDF